MIDIGLLFFEFVSFGLKFFQILLDGIGMYGFLFDHAITTGNSGNKAINLILGHFALFDMIFLMFQVFSQTCVQHLRLIIKVL